MSKTPISRSGRFAKGPSKAVSRYSESISFDWKLFEQDIDGSIAHATMLAKQKILTPRERNQIVRGLEKIKQEIHAGKFKWKASLEDVHMNIESALTARVPAAAKLHTARSRNDQVATDLRLWVRESATILIAGMQKLQKSLVTSADRTQKSNKHWIAIPGYTHLQRAQPVLAAHHLLAYVEMLDRDISRFNACAERANISPLGSGAIAGTSLPINRELTSQLLGFNHPSANSMDAVSDRDFVAEFIFCAALTGVHLSRLAEDWIIWSSSEFSFITIGDEYTTGSSLMPQKKNPDVAELGRGKTGRLIGNLVTILTLLKGLPLTYNRDLQEDKEPLFDSMKTLSSTLEVFAGMIESTRFNPKACEKAVSDPNLLATEIADELVRCGIPFRQAHHVVGVAVAYAEKNKTTLAHLSSAEWLAIHPKLGRNVQRCLNVCEALKARNRLVGSPGIQQVEKQLSRWKKSLRI
jgi:argininosuccinate lyase